MQNWEQRTTNGISYITKPSWLNRGVDFAFSFRAGGVSDTPFKSLNLGLHVGDTPEAVLANRRSLLNVFNQDLDSMVCCEQVHGNRVVVVDNSHRGCGAEKYETAIVGYDGMVTNQPGLYLTTFYADCIPVCFYDPVQYAIGMSHSGWKGTMGRIVINTIEMMHNQFGSMPEDIEVFIGPGIKHCCFEIQYDLARKVKAEFNEFNDIIYKGENDKYHWNLHSTIKQLLIKRGIKSYNITACDICSACNTDRFFSYRSEHGKTGRMGALLGLRYRGDRFA